MARKRRSKEELEEVGALVERLREFVRLNYNDDSATGATDRVS